MTDRSSPDIAERLINFRVWNNRQAHYEPVLVCIEAAKEIERLRAFLQPATPTAETIRIILSEEADIDFAERRIDYGNAIERIASLTAPSGDAVAGDATLRNLAQQLQDAAHYSTELSRLESHCREIARKLEVLAEESDDAAARPMQADIAQIISDGWRNGKTAAEVAEAVLRKFDGAAQPSQEPTRAQITQAFETIRLKLIKCLEEPERSAFWLAEQMRDALAVPSTDQEAGK